MRQPRQPRAPRVRRGGDTATAADPMPVVQRAAAWAPFKSGHSPRPRFAPWAPPAQPAAAGAPTTNGAPGVATANDASPFATPAAATTQRQVDASNAWNDRSAERMHRQQAFSRRDTPQGETQLVAVWARKLLNEMVPATACVIWLERIDPLDNRYVFNIPGTAVAGARPDLELFTVADKQRRQRGIAERFVGRIECVNSQGEIITIGGGEIAFPADPNAGTSASWGSPAPTWAPPYGMPGYGMPGYGMPGMPGMMPGMPGMMGGYGMSAMMPGGYGMHPAFMQAYQNPKVKNDPELAGVFQGMMSALASGQQQAASMQFEMMKLMLKDRDVPAKTEPNQLETLTAIIGVAKDLAGLSGGGDSSGGMHFHKLDDGTQIVSNGKGQIDKEMTGVLALKDVLSKGVTAIGRRRAAGPGAAGGAGPAASAGAPPGPPKQVTQGK